MHQYWNVQSSQLKHDFFVNSIAIHTAISIRSECVCSKCCPFALTQARSRFRHWSIALSTVVCSKAAHTSTSRCFSRDYHVMVFYTHALACNPKFYSRRGWGLDCWAAITLEKWRQVYLLLQELQCCTSVCSSAIVAMVTAQMVPVLCKTFLTQ